MATMRTAIEIQDKASNKIVAIIRNVETMTTSMKKADAVAEKMENSGAAAMGSLAQTPEGKMQQFAGTMGNVAEQIGGNVVGSFMALIDTAQAFVNSEAGQWLLNGASMGINIIVQGITWLAAAVAWLAGMIQQNWGVIQPILMAIGLMLLPTILGYLWAMIAPLLAQAAVWLMLNWPILLVIGAIALLIWAAGEMGVTFGDVCGFIAGVLGGLYAYFFNVVASLYNYWVAFVEFFANCFNHPVYSVKRLFVNLANTVLDLVKSIAGAIDAVFGSNLAGGVASLQNQMESWLGEMPEGYKVMEKMEMKNIAETVGDWNAGGKAFGKGIGDKLASFTSGFDISGQMSGAGGAELGSDSFGGGAGGGKNIGRNIGKVGEVGKINSEVDISREDLELLRDIAEARFVQNFVTLTPQVSMQVEAINHNADADRLLAEMERRLEEEFVMAAEGVYS